jgi:hypothetical protein
LGETLRAEVLLVCELAVPRSAPLSQRSSQQQCPWFYNGRLTLKAAKLFLGGMVNKLSTVENDLPAIGAGRTFCKADPCKKPDGLHFHARHNSR